MSVLTLVRHGQASLFAEDYDCLSPLGERQATALGEHWARTGTVFERVYSGPAKRHLRTAELAAEACRSAGLVWPQPVVLTDLDEFPGVALTRRYLPQVAHENPRIGALAEDLRRAHGGPDHARAIELLFEAFTTMWVRQEFDASEIETWEMFETRVQRGLDEVRNHGAKGAGVAVFSSAGPTAIAVQMAHGLPPLQTLQLAWLVRNSACSEFLFSGERFSLLGFNAVPHLVDPALVTYR
jgi:broad specificity phosphatase PhoE